MDRMITLATSLVITMIIIVRMSVSSWALNSCGIERPSEVVSFQRGSALAGAPLPADGVDPTILLRATENGETLQLGVGGSITLKFRVPVANYPAAGLLHVERPQGAPPCSSYPVRAEISGSIDGEHFIPLGSMCESTSFQLGTFPWIAYLRIQDVTDASDPAFGSTPIGGFDLRSASGPGCLKYARCAVSAAPDFTVSNSKTSYALSLSHSGDDFVFEQPASFEEYGNGSARLSGTVYRVSAPSTAYEIIVSLTGRVQSPPAHSPVLELKPSAYSSAGGTVDPSSWYYYKHLNGTLFGKGDITGETIRIESTLRALQVGDGAHGRNTLFGASGGFAYGLAPSLNRGEIRIGLTSCSSPTSPPPSLTVPDPTSSPGGGVTIESPTCQTHDISHNLAVLDNNLSRRFNTIKVATRLLLREDRSRRNVRFGAHVRSKTRNLYVLAWGDVWRHDRVVQSCSPSSACLDVHLEPMQAALAASAEALDSSVEKSLRYIQKKLSSQNSKRALKRLIQKHTAQRGAFMRTLSELPKHSCALPSQTPRAETPRAAKTPRAATL